MAIVGRAKYTRSRESSRRRDELSRARVYFARPTIAIAKIRDYSQSTLSSAEASYSLLTGASAEERAQSGKYLNGGCKQRITAWGAW